MNFAEIPAVIFGWLTANGVALLSAILSLVAGWYLSRFAYREVRRTLVRVPGIDRNVAPLFSQVTRYGIVLLAIITAMNFLGISSNSILAVVGAAGLAIVLSLQSTLSNIAAGIMLLWLRPIAIGEYIVGDGVAGIVIEIGLFGTRLRSTSGLYVFTPNQKLWNGAITNHSREARRRVEVMLAAPDSIDVGKSRRLLLDLAAQDKRVLADPPPAVHVDSFSGSSINMQLRCWVKTPDYLATLYALTEGAKLALDRVLAEANKVGEVTVTPDPSQPSPDTVDRHAPGE